MGQTMVGHVAIRARQLRPGEAFAAVVPAEGLVEVIDLEGQQVAELIAFAGEDHAERLSLGVTRRRSGSVALQMGMTLYSSRGEALLELVEDTVGRHDLLWAAPTGTSAVATTDAVADPALATGSDGEAGEGSSGEPVPSTGGSAAVSGVATGFDAALAPFGLSASDAPDPVNLFMHLGIMKAGDFELRAPTSERGDRVVFRASREVLVAVRCSSADDLTNGENPTDILVRVYR